MLIPVFAPVVAFGLSALATRVAHTDTVGAAGPKLSLALSTLVPLIGQGTVSPWFTNQVDMGVMSAIADTRNHLGNAIFEPISLSGNGALVWIVVGALIVGWGALTPPGPARVHTLATGLLMWVGLGLSTLLVELGLKPIWDRPRPIEVNPQWDVFDLLTTGSSFPSGHTSWGFLVVPLLWVWDPRAGKGALVFAILMGVSRMYTGAHWLSDVIVGALCGLSLGGVLAVISCFAFKPDR